MDGMDGWMDGDGDGWMSCDAMLGEGEGGVSQTAGFPVPPRRGAAADGPKRVSEPLPTQGSRSLERGPALKWRANKKERSPIRKGSNKSLEQGLNLSGS